MKPKKSLGQNFLTSQKAVADIIKAGELSVKDFVLEIGPGQGILTEKLLETGAKVLAIEKDKYLMGFLNQRFSKQIKSGQLKILNQDVLEFKIQPYPQPLPLGGEKCGCAPPVGRGWGGAGPGDRSRGVQKYKLIANIPYYITGEILRKFLSDQNPPELMVLLLQKEVAERIVARDKKESILSLSVKFYGVPKIISKVSAGSFFPKPKVDSAILKIQSHPRPLPLGGEKYNCASGLEQKFFQIVKASFAHKRKMMLGNLKSRPTPTPPNGRGTPAFLPSYWEGPGVGLEGWNKIDWEKIFLELNLNKKIRAEDLTKEDFIKITKLVLNYEMSSL